MTSRRFRHGTVLGAWLGATVAVTAISWVGVHAVGREVDGSTETVLSAADVAHAARPLRPPRSAPPAGSSHARGQPPMPAPTASTDPATTAPTSSTSSGGSMGAATFAGPGGQITVSCRGMRITLVSATPANGYQASVLEAGPGRIAVRFAATRPAAALTAACQGGRPHLASPPSTPAHRVAAAPLPPPAGRPAANR